MYKHYPKRFKKSVFFCLMFLVCHMFAQNIKISGTVSTRFGLKLSEVTIAVVGSNASVTSSASGSYLISAAKDDVLLFSLIGFKDKKVKVGSNYIVDIVLDFQSNSIDEFYEVGYGSSQKKDLSEASVKISNDVLENRFLPSADQALKGRVAGFYITDADGTPGGGVRSRIRGTSTLSGAGSPLYIIDGIPLDLPGTSDSYNGSTAGNPLAFINPNDIESIQVLKDAGATAIYGSRAANGVVLVTTKNGVSADSDFSVVFDVKTGFTRQMNTYDLMPIEEYAAWQSYRGLEVSRPEAIDTDWQDILSTVGIVKDVNIAIQGKDENTGYYLSYGDMTEPGVLQNTSFRRQSARFNLDQEITKNAKFTGIVNYSWLDRKGVFAGMNTVSTLTDNLRYPPNYNPYNGSTSNSDILLGFSGNPLVQSEDTKKNTSEERLNAKIGLDLKLFNGITFKPSFALNNFRSGSDIFFPNSTALGNPLNGKAIIRRVRSNSWIQENLFVYATRIKDHAIKATIGNTLQGYKTNLYEISTSDFPISLLNTNSIGSGNKGSIPITTNNRSELVSFFGRLNYNYSNTYYATVTLRHDSWNRKYSNKQKGFYPSLSLKWRLNKEEFLENTADINDLSLRMSYGRTGNHAIPFYETPSNSLPSLQYNNNSNVYREVPTNQINDNLKLETTDQFNIGLDLSVFKDRLQLTTNAYYEKTTDAIIPVAIGSNGIQLKNEAVLQNKGLEFSANAILIDRGFQWRTSFNVAFNRNKVLDLGASENLVYDIKMGQGLSDEYRIEKGSSIGNWYGYVRDGIYSSWDEINSGSITDQLGYIKGTTDTWNPQGSEIIPGMIKYKDLNNDGVIDANDRQIIGNSMPDFTGGFSHSISYKQFSLDVLFTFSYGAENFNVNYYDLTRSNNDFNKLAVVSDFFKASDVAGEWVFNNTDAKFSNPQTHQFEVNDSDNVSDASFIRLANVVFAYQLPKSIASRIRVKRARVYMSGDNLLLWTKYNGLDPEVSTGQSFASGGSSSNLAPGLDASSYPSATTVSLGINLTF